MKWLKKLFKRKRGATQLESYWVIPPYSPSLTSEVRSTGSFSEDV